MNNTNIIWDYDSINLLLQFVPLGVIASGLTIVTVFTCICVIKLNYVTLPSHLRDSNEQIIAAIKLRMGISGKIFKNDPDDLSNSEIITAIRENTVEAITRDPNFASKMNYSLTPIPVELMNIYKV